jgi:hypothetical protein
MHNTFITLLDNTALRFCCSAAERHACSGEASKACSFRSTQTKGYGVEKLRRHAGSPTTTTRCWVRLDPFFTWGLTIIT